VDRIDRHLTTLKSRTHQQLESQAFPAACVNYNTQGPGESTYAASVSSLTRTRRQWRVLFWEAPSPARAGESPRMVSTDHFRQGLLAQMSRAAYGGRTDVLINSGELYRSLGGYPGSALGMPSCCDAMQAEMKAGDVLLLGRTNGAGMIVRCLLPHVD
jgi:hypothetical protein